MNAIKKFLFLAVFLTAGIYAQKSDLRLVFADTISNSQTKTGYIDLTGLPPYDSVGVSVLQSGAVSISKDLSYALGVITYLPNIGTGSQRVSYFNTGKTISLAGDQTTTGSGTAYGVCTKYFKRDSLMQHNQLKISLTAKSTGNTVVVGTQKVAVFLVVFRKEN